MQVPFSKVIYIESSDFRLKDSKDYYGLAPGKTVMLRYWFIYNVTWSRWVLLVLCIVPCEGNQSDRLMNCISYRYAFPVKCIDVIYAEDQLTVVELHVEYDPLKSTKPKVVKWNFVWCFVHLLYLFSNYICWCLWTLLNLISDSIIMINLFLIGSYTLGCWAGQWSIPIKGWSPIVR